MTPWGTINRYRGSGHKLRGYALFWLAFMVPYAALCWTLPWWRIAVVGLAYAVTVLWLFKWDIASDDWRHLKKIRAVWRKKGIFTFAIMGAALLDPFTACAGVLMQRAGDYYYNCLLHETDGSLRAAEIKTGDLFFCLGWLLPLVIAAKKLTTGL